MNNLTNLLQALNFFTFASSQKLALPVNTKYMSFFLISDVKFSGLVLLVVLLYKCFYLQNVLREMLKKLVLK